jgi:hypothetical protein
VEVTAKPDNSHPFSILAGMPPGAVMWITIMRCYLGAPNNAVNIFAGYVREIKDSTDKYTAQCESRLKWLTTKLPRFLIGTTCNWVLYDPNTCTIARGNFTTTVTIQKVAVSQLPQLQVTFNFDLNLAQQQQQNWYAGGTLEVGVGLNYELREIIASQWMAPVGETPGYLLLTLSAQLRKNGVGAFCQVTAGCDHTVNGANGCIPKFDNFQNFGGFVDVPQENLALRGLNLSNAMGGKKA